MEFIDYVERQRTSLMRFATVLTGRAWLAEDLVCDVLARAYERWERIGAMERPDAYVRRMIVNEYMSWHRRLARTVPRDDADLDVEQVDDGSEQRAVRDEMLRRLDRLPRRQRTALALRYYVDLPDAEIAAYLGCRESTVRSQIARALATLRLDQSPPVVAVI